MSLAHFFAGAPEQGETVTLEPDDAHHALRSLRLRVGDRFSSSDGEGAVARCRVTRASGSVVEGEVEERSVEPRPAPFLGVVLAAPKGERLTWAVQKLTEVGADQVVVAEAPRSIRRWDRRRGERIAGRLRAVSREAAKQSRRRFLPRVEGPVAWAAALEGALRDGHAVVLWERASEPLSAHLPPSPERVTLAIGPEGGIADEDARAAEAAGASLASLGPAILRTETAAIVSAAIALSRYGRLG